MTKQSDRQLVICERLRELGYAQERHIRLYGEEFYLVPRQNSIRMELNPRVTLLHPQAILGETGMLRFGKLLIRKVPRERGVLTRDTMIFRLLGTWPSQSVNSPITRLHSPI